MQKKLTIVMIYYIQRKLYNKLNNNNINILFI